MSGEATPPLIVAVLLASETDATRGHVVTTLTLPSSHLTLPLTKLRPTLTSSLPSSLRQRSFIFLTTHGWEVEQAMEKTTRVSQVFREDSCMISIRLSYPQPRLGLVAEGHPHIPLGFIFCDPAQPLSHLSRELQAQLPSLHRSLTATGYSVLDSSGWPIAREQEHLFTLAEAVCGRMIRLLCHPQTRQPSLSLSLLPPAGSLEHTRPSLSLPELPQGMAEERAEVAESSLLEQSMTTDSYSSTMAPTAPPGTTPYEILLSYVHKEAADEATSLKEALHEAGYRVFLDVDCIQGGTDWQDVLNDAISNCKVFVPLITNQYGQTLWTNREVKLADVLGKVIIPVNFLSSWPPKCLAIQFAATQFISWLHSSPDEDWDEDTVTKVCSDIVQRYKLEVEGGVMGVIAAEGAGEEEGEGEGEDTPNSFAQMDTQIIVEKEEEEEEEERRQVQMLAKVATGQFSPLQAPQLPRTHRRSTLKSYASSLPSSLPEGYRKSIQESRTGKPLVIISCHTSQKEFGHKLAGEMEGRGYEVWCSCDIMNLTDETASLLFQKSADEAGVVVFVLSKEFTECSFCEKQVYYCEQRKRIIPLIFEAVQLPHWASMLIGTSTFVDCRASSYRQTLFERVEEAVNPSKREVSLQVMLREKGEVARLCAEVSAKLPKGVLVYVSGGTRFFSPCGEEVCREFGRQLAQDLNISLVTGGFYGVGETVGRSFHEQRLKNGQASGVWHVVAERDSQDKSSQTRQNKDGSFPPVPYGQTLFAGSSVRQRETLTPHVVGLCVLIEGGPGAAFEAQQFAWWGNWVIPVKMTGGAAGGLFNVPQTIFQRPPCIAEADWSLLGDKDATPSQVAAAIVRIIRTLTFEDGVISPQSAGVRRRRKGGVRGGIQRSETMPYEPDTFQPMKRTFSESRSPQLQAKSTSHT